MAYIGGDIIEIVCDHPDLGNFRFSPKANESFKFDSGGIRNGDDKNAVTGNGQMILQKNRVLWMLEGNIAIDLENGYEEESINKLMSSSNLGTWTITHISGAIYKGVGIPVGDFEIDTNTASGPLKLQGSGSMEKIN